MDKDRAIVEFKKMWLWLSKHPAHDKEYYVQHVAKPNPTWKNDCPLCALEEDDCNECLILWDNGKGSLCSDPTSPLSKWKNTNIEDVHKRTWHAGELMGLVEKNL